MTEPAESYPRQSARTRRYTLGAPRTFTVADDGSRVVFLRSGAGDDPVNQLWVLDVATGAERVVADPRAMLAGADEGDLPLAERARRERMREAGGGIVAYDADPGCTAAVAALGGRLFLVDLVGGGPPRELPSQPGAYDPRLSPTGAHVAYVAGRALRVVATDPGADPATADRELVGEDDPDVSWGSADFVAGEEMGRTRGHWWDPEGRRLVVERVDVGPVLRWHVADPAEPARPPTTLRYPAAGTANAVVGLAVIDLDGGSVPVTWELDGLPYLASVRWSDEGLLLEVEARGQRRSEVLVVNPVTGATTLRLVRDEPVWVELVAGTPTWAGRRIVSATDDAAADTRRLTVDGEPISPPGLHVRRVLGVDGDRGEIVVAASTDDPTATVVAAVAADGGVRVLTPQPGVHDAVVGGGGVLVTTSSSLEHDGARVRVWRHGVEVATITSHAEVPVVVGRPTFAVVGSRRLHAAVLVPEGHDGAPLPVLMDPYGGPHAQRVVRSRGAWHASQWLADQGFAVVVVDGRGTPGRGPAFEKAVHLDLAEPVLDDQVDALHALAAERPELDLARVAIRGWSFGGYLAALAVLRRPDVFHAAVAGAPVTDWRLYDTHYTERYLGHPDEEPEAYARTSLLADAPKLERPLLLIHGLADDNVVAAHTIQLSRALLEAGRPHQVLPLSGVTHMTPQEVVAENLLLLQVAFLRDALRLA